MLSRVANSLYWASRYVERAENVARFISVNLNLSLDSPVNGNEQWWPLVVTTGDDQSYLERYTDCERDSAIEFLAFDMENPNSIASCLRMARENARAVREAISNEMWEHINKFYLNVTNCGGMPGVTNDLYGFFTEICTTGQQFMGVTDATMTHGEGWNFCRLGRMMERADKTSRILDVKYFILLPQPQDVGSPYDDIQWMALLRSTSALEMYRQRHGVLTPPQVVEFLILDREFPRAVLHCLTHANDALHSISGTKLGGYTNPAEQQLGQLRAGLAYTTADCIIESGLHEFIDDLQTQLNGVGKAISETFFALRPV